jgi:hypothetical protein
MKVFITGENSLLCQLSNKHIHKNKYDDNAVSKGDSNITNPEISYFQHELTDKQPFCKPYFCYKTLMKVSHWALYNC